MESRVNQETMQLTTRTTMLSTRWIPVVHVTSMVPLLRASESKHVTSTFVPGTTRNCDAVMILLYIIKPLH